MMSKLLKLFDNDKVLLVVSLLVALAMWMMVISERNPQTDSIVHNVPIAYLQSENLDASGLHIISQSATAVDVKISGRWSEVYPVSAQDISATANLSEIYAPGTYEIPVSVSLNSTGVTIDGVTPSVLSVEVDYIVKNKRDIEMEYTGQLPEGYEIDEALLSVTSVTVEGPENVLKNIAKAVATVNLDGITEDQSIDCDLKLVDAAGQEIQNPNITVSSTQATVDLSILMVKELPVQIVLDGEVDLSAAGITVAANPAAVTIKGKKAVIEEIEKIETTPIEQAHIPQSTATITVALALPEGVSCENETVSVGFTVKDRTETNEHINEN